MLAGLMVILVLLGLSLLGGFYLVWRELRETTSLLRALLNVAAGETPPPEFLEVPLEPRHTLLLDPTRPQVNWPTDEYTLRQEQEARPSWQ